ncbi:TadE/TadG family type IV pilus assembly protein [Brevundimonas faecalis]|uniref:Flp pilus assembly protein TadG n=1 Tax=Brevundimonas faecalis TaxID=947378 RepID=A0ABV2RBN5_9CAUL
MRRMADFIARPSRIAPRLRRDRRGATAVEFAMVALPFFMMLFAILEIGVILTLDAVMETAVADTSRLVRTGQANNLTQDQIKERFCAHMSVFSGDCSSRVYLDVRSIEAFEDASGPNPTSGDAFNTKDLGYTSGVANQKMLVRIWYKHPVATPFLAQALTRMKNGSVYLTTTMAFQNEPYS